MIVKAIERAYRVMKERNWDTVYWAIDLHGVCLKSNYAQGGYEWINPLVLRGLRFISERAENKIILWSSAYPTEYPAIIKFFNDSGIKILAFNENPEAADTPSGCFSSKFYFSVLLDDKAGFDPDNDWYDICTFYQQMNIREIREMQNGIVSKVNARTKA